MKITYPALQSSHKFERGDFFMACKAGDKVKCVGIIVTIAEIHYQDYFHRGADDDGWMIEFVDTNR